MGLGMKILIGVLGLLALITVSVVGSVIGVNNDCVTQEKGLKAQYDQNRNNYDSMFKKFKEAAAVPVMYTEDLKKVYDSSIQKRYGNQGSKAMFQWLKEHNPNFDSKLYVRLQQIIESGRNDFEANQKMLLDKKRAYETRLDVFPGGMVARTLGFPKVELNKFDIVTSAHTEQVFKEKKSGPIQLR